MGAHKWALVAAFVFGAAGIVGLKYDEETPFRAAFWSIAVILLYAAAAWAIRRAGRRSARRLDPEAAGDNCYYLGFVFTLVSLAVTLWRLSPETGGALNDETFPQLISGFGVALSSTIVGIVLRVLHVRMEAEPETLARDARDGLAAAVDEFRDNLLSANRLLNGFAVETAQLLSEQRADMRKLAAETEASHRRALTESVDAHMNALRDALGAATERAVAAIADGVIEVTRAAHDELAQRVAELGRRETETLGSLVDGVSRFSGELTRFETAMGALAASLESVGAGVSERFGPAAGAFEAGMARAAERFAESGKALSDLTASLETARESVANRLVPAARAFGDGAVESARELGDSGEAMSGFAALGTGVARAIGALERADKAFSELALRLDGAGAGLADKLDPAAGAFDAGVARAAERLAESGAVLSELTAALETAREGMAGGLVPAARDFGNGAVESARALGDANKAMSGIAMLAASIGRTVEALGKSDKAFTELARRLDGAGAGLADKLDPAASAFRDRAEEAAKTLLAANDALNRAAENLARLAEEAARHASSGPVWRVLNRLTRGRGN